MDQSTILPIISPAISPLISADTSQAAFNLLCPSTNLQRAVLSSVVSAAFDVPAKDLRLPKRGRAKVALARQVAMYLSHVVLRMTLGDAGRLYSRDRTTAAHACRLVEDLRDEQRFDTLLSILEDMVRAEILHRAARDCGPKEGRPKEGRPKDCRR
jgi:chromosomal replication initiation ATPase DnaA